MQKMARQGKMARTQGIKARQGMPSASAIAIIGMPSASAGQGIIIGSRTAGRSRVAQYSHTDFERVLRCAVVKIFE
jgi:GTPase involved in cell partitioning and DNA repair